MIWDLSIEFNNTVKSILNWSVPSFDNKSIDTGHTAWNKMKPLLDRSYSGGTLFSGTNVYSYSLIYTTPSAYRGGVVAANGEIHFVPYNANVGQFINKFGDIFTYTLATHGPNFYSGGVLGANGDIHFIPFNATRGQRVVIGSTNPVATTYDYGAVFNIVKQLTNQTFIGGVMSPNGDIHFVPHSATFGARLVRSLNYTLATTYSLTYNTTSAYFGGVLAPNGDIHFVPYNATVGQKVANHPTNPNSVSTYTLATHGTNFYSGGVLAPNGDIHFVPYNANVGQRLVYSSNYASSTYPLQYTINSAYSGGVLAPNGDIHFVPKSATVGKKVRLMENGSINVSTYPISVKGTQFFSGGVLNKDGILHFIPFNSDLGQKINTLVGIPFTNPICMCPFFNKL